MPVFDSDDEDDTPNADTVPVVLEEDPTGRYVKYDEVLHDGPFLEAFRGYDKEEGLDVAWYEFRWDALKPLTQEHCAQRDAILSLVHPNIVRIHRHWLSDPQDLFIFVADYFGPAGSLKHVISGGTSVSRRVKVIKRWCRQILEGVAFLHIHNPPICHGAISISSTYISVNSGAIKLCSPLRSFLNRGRSEANNSLATMAPELCGQNHDEKVDVYAFGMLMLEMVTCEKPYSECSTQGRLLKKVSLGCLPNMLTRVRHAEARDFLQCCLRPVEQRISAAQLLEHEFLVDSPEDNQTVGEALLGSQSLGGSPGISIPKSPRSAERSSITHVNATPPSLDNEESPPEAGATAFDVLSVTPAVEFRTLRLVGRLSQEEVCKEIELVFRLNEDTCSDVAEELVDAFGDFQELRSAEICETIEKAILDAPLSPERNCCQQQWQHGHCSCRTALEEEEEAERDGLGSAEEQEEIAAWKRLDQLVIDQEEELRQIALIQQRHGEETQQALAECARLSRLSRR